MPSNRSRRSLLGVCGTVIGVTTPGCISNTSISGGPTISQSDISDESAKERALAAEEEFIEDRLSAASCLDDWGTWASVGIDEEATIQERTSKGVVVDVTHPFWYTAVRTEQSSSRTGISEADGATNAQYLVTIDATERLDGDELSPC